MDPDAEAPAGLVGRPVEVGDPLAGKQLDPSDVLPRRGEGVRDLTHEIV